MVTSPLIQAILDGKIDTVRSLIRTNPEMLGVCSEIGSFPYQIAVNNGLANQQTTLLRAKAPGSENFAHYSELLINYLGDISEGYACAGWLYDIEFIVWKIVFTNESVSDDYYGFNKIDDETKEDLHFLSQKAKGWAAWREEDHNAVFVSVEEWEKIWNERNFS